MHALRNRRLGLGVALFVWFIASLFHAHERGVLEAERERAECVAGLKTIAGAVEMYALDKNVRFESSTLAAGPARMHEILTAEGYLQAPVRCGERLLEIRGDDAHCPRHAMSLHAQLNRPAEAGDLRLHLRFMAFLATWFAFPLAFWIAAGVRSFRWGRRYRAGQVRLLPASWVIALNLLFAPAGMLAMGHFRQAAWQGGLIAGAVIGLGWPLHLAVLPATAWVAIARYREGR